jgi:hypothetical protein
LVLQLVRAGSTHGTRDDLAGGEHARAVERAQGRAPLQHDDHLLVRMVQVKRRAVLTGVDLVERRSQPLRAGGGAEPRRPSPQRRVRPLYPLRFVDVRHCRDGSGSRASTVVRAGRNGSSPGGAVSRRCRRRERSDRPSDATPPSVGQEPRCRKPMFVSLVRPSNSTRDRTRGTLIHFHTRMWIHPGTCRSCVGRTSAGTHLRPARARPAAHGDDGSVRGGRAPGAFSRAFRPPADR